MRNIDLEYTWQGVYPQQIFIEWINECWETPQGRVGLFSKGSQVIRRYVLCPLGKGRKGWWSSWGEFHLASLHLSQQFLIKQIPAIPNQTTLPKSTIMICKYLLWQAPFNQNWTWQLWVWTPFPVYRAPAYSIWVLDGPEEMSRRALSTGKEREAKRRLMIITSFLNTLISVC